MKSHAPILVFGAAAALACHATEPLEPPLAIGSRTALFIVENGGALSSVAAFEVDEDGRLVDLVAPPSRPGDLWWVVGFACPRDLLGLEQRAVELVAEQAASDEWLLPAPTTVTRIAPAALGEWTDAEPSAVVDLAVRRIALPDRFRCSLVRPELAGDVKSFDFPRMERLYAPTFAAELDGGTLFVTTIQSPDFTFTTTVGHGAHFFDLEAQETTDVENVPGPVLAGHRADDGELWLVTPEAIHRGRPDTGFVEAASLEAFQPIRRAHVAGRGSADAIDLSISTTEWNGSQLEPTRRWLRYRAGAVEQLAITDAGARMPLTAYLDANRLVAIRIEEDPPALHQLENGTLTVHPVPGEHAMHELGRLPDGRLLVRTDGPTYTWTGSEFEELGFELPFMATHVPTPDGLLYLGSRISGFTGRYADGPLRVAQYLEWTGTCQYAPFESSNTTVYILPLRTEDAVVSLEISATAGVIRATVITFVSGPPSCALR